MIIIHMLLHASNEILPVLVLVSLALILFLGGFHNMARQLIGSLFEHWNLFARNLFPPITESRDF